MIYEHKTYYSSAQTQIYFNDHISNEIASIDFQYSSQHIPFFGYRSMHFDTVSNSRVQVSGRLIVNYLANSYFTSLIYPNAIEIEKSSEESKNAYSQDRVLRNFVTMTNEELNIYRNYNNQDANVSNNSILDGVRPEMVALPFDIKIVDNSRFSVNDRIPSILNNEDKQLIIIKDVFVDALSRVRSVEQGVIKDSYAFMAKTVI